MFSKGADQAYRRSRPAAGKAKGKGAPWTAEEAALLFRLVATEGLGHWDGKDFIDMGWSPSDRPHFDSERRGWAADMLDGGTREFDKDIEHLNEAYSKLGYRISTPSEEDTNG